MEWDSFLSYVEDGDVIPVIGNELSLVRNDDGTTEPVSNYITAKLGRKYGETDSNDQNFHELALKYKDKHFCKDALNIYKGIEPDRFLSEPVRRLASIIDFKYYISARFDDLLVNAIRNARMYKENELKIINYSLDSSNAKDPRVKKIEPKVTVLNLLGTLRPQTKSSPKVSEIDEEELLEHFFSIATREKLSEDIADFIEKMKDKILLFIGCDFPDWFMRFIIRTLADERYKGKKQHTYIVPDRLDLCPKLHQFLNHLNEKVVVMDEAPGGNAVAFVNELYKRWVKNIKKCPIKYKGTVFLSYNHRDRERVASFKNLLRAKGIKDVWFDIDKLKPGDQHKEEIEEKIIECKVFIPMISENCLEHPDSYTWTVEWAKVQARLKADRCYKKSRFQLIPCILDDTSDNDERIPAFMREIVTWKLNENEENFINKIVTHLEPIEDHANGQN